MYKTTLLLALLALNVSTLEAQNAFRGFEGPSQDNWNYTSNIPFYAMGQGNSDLWSVYSQANGRIEKAYAGQTYLAGRDLDNPYTEAYTGLESPEHILTFEPRAIGGLGAEITFRTNYVLLDKNDYIYYQVAYDNGSNWTSLHENIDVYRTTQNGQFSSNGWIEINFNVPTGKEYVRMRVVVYQNGNGYLGFDNFELTTNTLAVSNNLIEGFTFGPNPTQGVLRLNAKVILDKVSLYDILGKRVLNQKGDSTDMILDLSHLSKGVYLAKVESNGLIQTIKVVKK